MSTSTKTKSPLPWFGSDNTVAPRLGAYFDDCAHVTIPFAGGLGILPHLKARAILSGDPDQDDLAPMMTEAANKARKMLEEYDRAVKSVVDDLIGKWASSEDRDVSDWAVHLDVGALWP